LAKKSEMSTAKRRNPIVEKLAVDIPITVLGTFNKALKGSSAWTDKDEFLDVIYWIRQILGVLIGVVWGVIPMKGLVGIILFMAVNLAVVYIYFSMYQRVDEEEFGGISEILKEGLMTSLATFFVTWIILYSALHVD